MLTGCFLRQAVQAVCLLLVFFFCLVGFVLLLPIRILLFKEKDAFTDTIVTRDLLSE